jgi:hypothetical protein
MKRFRFHLSTLLVTTLVAGAFIGLNLRPEREVIPVRKYRNGQFAAFYPPGPLIYEERYGWPAKMVTRANFGEETRLAYTTWSENYARILRDWLPNEYSKIGITENVALAILIWALAISLADRAALLSKKSAGRFRESETQIRSPLSSTT